MMLLATILLNVSGISLTKGRSNKLYEKPNKNYVKFMNYEGVGPFGKQSFDIRAFYTNGEMSATVAKMGEKHDSIKLILIHPRNGHLQEIIISNPDADRPTVIKAEDLRGGCKYIVRFDDKANMWFIEKKEMKKKEKYKKEKKPVKAKDQMMEEDGIAEYDDDGYNENNNGY